MSASLKRRSNVTVDRELLYAARSLGLNVSTLTEAALATAVREARRKAGVAAAMAERRAWIERNGPPLVSWQVWRLG